MPREPRQHLITDQDTNKGLRSIRDSSSRSTQVYVTVQVHKALFALLERRKEVPMEMHTRNNNLVPNYRGNTGGPQRQYKAWG